MYEVIDFEPNNMLLFTRLAVPSVTGFSSTLTVYPRWFLPNLLVGNLSSKRSNFEDTKGYKFGGYELLLN